MTAADETPESPPAPDAAEPDGATGEAPAAPPVVVVMVVHDPGWWFEEALASVAAQDYPNTSVFLVDAASADPDDVRARVASVLPGAHLRHLDVNPGFGAAANEALKAVQGAAFHLLCHDDVRLAPDAVRLLVEEAYRSNAGIVGPKVVDWTDERRLLQVGMGADRFGQPSPYVERGDLDQAQHDAVRDAFYVPGAVTLVRADLFEALGGFDPAITLHADDLDLCWRAHVAGARVVVAPQARVAHIEALGARRPVDDRRRLQARHRLRAMRVASTTGTRLRAVPVAFFLAMLEVLQSLLMGRFRHARDIASAWSWNLRHGSTTRGRRRALSAVRRVPDSDVRALQVGGSARLSGYLRGQLGREGSRPRDVVSNLREARATTSLVVWILVVLFLLVGSRELLFGSIPAIGDLSRLDPPGSMLSRWVSGFDATGLGSTAPNATGIGAFGVLGTVALGATGLVRTVAVLGPLLLGVLGIWRLAGPIGSRRARLVALVAYAAVPVGTNALSEGRWAGIVAYGMAPWVLSILASSSGVAPYGPLAGSPGPGVRTRPLVQRIVAVGVVVAVGAVIDAQLLLVLPLCGLALVIGGLLTGRLVGAARVLAATVGGTAVALVLHLPWSLSFADGWSAIVPAGSTAGRQLDVADVLHFATGPLGAGVTGLLLLVTGLLPLLIGRRWRLAWAVRAWAVAATGFGLALAGAQGWLPVQAPAPEVLLAPAAAALALAAGLGMVAFEVDLPDYHFGWRQIVSLLAGASFVVAVVPALTTVFSGRWEMPGGDYDRALAFMRTEAADTPFRALWLGDAGVLPGVGWHLDAPTIDDLGPDRTLTYLSTEAGVPTASDRWPGATGDATPQMADAVRTAAEGGTARLGALLAPMGVRYVVVPLAPAPDPYALDRRYDPTELLAMLEGQLDLDGVTVNPGVRVYRNAAWGPIRAQLPAGTEIGPGGGTPISRMVPQLSGAPVALPDGSGPTDRQGGLDGASTVYVGQAGGDRWSLKVDGADVARRDALGWSSTFAVESGGDASLSFDTPATRYAALAGQLVLWVLAIGYLLRVRVVEDERDTLPVDAPLAPDHVVLSTDAPPADGGGPAGADTADRSAPGDPGPDLGLDLPTMAVPAITLDEPGRRGRRSKGKHAR